MKLFRAAAYVFILLLAGIHSQPATRAQGTATATPALVNPNRAQTLVPTITPSGTPRQLPRTQTPAPEFLGAPFLDQVIVEMLFPVGVVAQLRVGAPLADIDFARYTLTDEGGKTLTSGTLDLTTNARDGGEDTTVIYADYLFAPADAPRLFSTLRYEWTVRLKANVTGVVRGSVTFQDVRLFGGTQPILGWREVSDDALGLRMLNHNPDLSLPLLRTRLSRVLERLRAETGDKQPFRFVLYDPGYRFCTALPGFDKLFAHSRTTARYLDCREEDGRAVYQQQGYTVLERADLSLDRLEAQLVDMMVRRTYIGLWGARQVPSWFSDGVLRLFAPRDQRSALNTARAASREQRLLSLAALQQPPVTVDQGRLWAAQSYLLVLYIASRYGATAPLEIARQISQAEDFEAALQAVTAADQPQLYAGWEQWLLTPRAESDVTWTIYTALTPQPTDTLRPAPTITPTSAEPTATRTPTETQPPLASITPLPTRTPLPPGSLRSPTPVPTPGAGAPSAPGSIPTGVVVAGLGLIVLLLAVAIIAAMRSGSRPRSKS